MIRVDLPDIIFKLNLEVFSVLKHAQKKINIASSVSVHFFSFK